MSKESIDVLTSALRRCCEALDGVTSRDAAIAVGFLADKYVSAHAAKVCYAETPELPASERAANMRKQAERLMREAERLESEVP